MKNCEIENAVNYYKRVKPQLTEILGFFSRIKDLENEYSKKLSPTLPITVHLAIERLKSGRYLIEGAGWSINKEIFGSIARDLIKLLRTPEETNSFEKLFSCLPNPVFAEIPKLTERLEPEKGNFNTAQKFIFNYILSRTLSVFYRKEATRFKDLDYKLYWTKTICPLCGNPPKISRLLKDTGKRMVSCHLCWSEWAMDRITCPYCLNASQDTLRYFYADDNKAYRVDVCDGCKKYMKTIDERILDRQVILEVEDIITYHLDTLALSEGYQSPLINFI